MNFKLLTLATLVCASATQMAYAADGAVNFLGQVEAATCDVKVEGVAGVATVTLPTVSSRSLAAKGDTTGRTSFNIELTNCAGNAQGVSAFFNSGVNVDPVSGHLLNKTGTATKVDLQLLDLMGKAPTVIKVGSTSQRSDTTKVAFDPNAPSVLSYAVEYVATGDAQPGTVVSSVTFDLDYN